MSTITFQCFSCNKLLKVGADKAGKRSKCPMCGTVLTVPVSSNGNDQPLMSESVGAPLPPPMPDSRWYAEEPRASRRKSAGPVITLCSIFLLTGAALLLVNAFLPWWRISVRLWTPEEAREKPQVDLKVQFDDVKSFVRIRRDNMDWYSDHLSSRDRARLMLLGKRDEFGGEPEHKFSKTLLGINTAGGVLGLVFAFLILAPPVVGVFIPVLRRWLWISAFISAIFGGVLLVFAILWLVGAPGEDAGGVMRQGIIIGPWLALAMAITLLSAGILDGILGVRRFARWLRASAPGQ